MVNGLVATVDGEGEGEMISKRKKGKCSPDGFPDFVNYRHL